MQHQLFYNGNNIDKGIEIPLDTSYYDQLTQLPMDAEFIYQTLLFNTINNVFNYGLIEVEHEQKVLHHFNAAEYETTMFYFSIEDPKREVIVPAYLHILKPKDGFLDNPITHSVLTVHNEDGALLVIGTGMHYQLDGQLLGMINFEYECEPYSFNFACRYNEAQQQFEAKTYFESTEIGLYLNEGLPHSFFDLLLKKLEAGELEKAADLVDYALSETEHLHVGSVIDEEQLDVTFVLKLEATSRLYSNTSGKDATAYGSLYEALERNYHHLDQEQLSVPLHIKLKVIKATDESGQNHELYLAVLCPLGKYEDDQKGLECRDHVNHETRLFLKQGDSYCLIGAGQGSSLVSNITNNILPYNGAGGFYHNETYGTFIYNNESFIIEGELFKVTDSFDIYLDYKRMLDAKSLEEQPLMYLEASFDPIGSELPIELNVPRAELDIAYAGLDDPRQLENVRDLMEYLNNNYCYMKDSQYFSPVWTQLQVGKVMDRKTGRIYEGYLVIFHHFGNLPIVPTAEQVEHFDELSDDEQDEIIGDYNGEFLECETRLILRRKSHYKIVGRGEAVFDPETKDYFGDGECIINGHEYSFNYTNDNFYLVEAHPTKDRVFFGKSSKVTVDYKQIETEEKTRKRSLE